MERLDMFIKSTVAIVGGVISYMVGGLGLAFTVLLGLMALDYLTGLMVATYTKSISSKIGSKGLIRKIYIVLLIGAVYLVEKVAFEQAGYMGDGIAIAYCVMEFVSITENGGKLGVPLPKSLRDIIAVLKSEDKKNEVL
jgi:toxin secretion/phage lysis holin